MTPTPPHRRRGGSLTLDPRLTDPALGSAAGLPVRFVNPSEAACGRGTDNPRGTLTLGTTYVVQQRYLGSFQTTLVLVDHEGQRFNSVHFEVVNAEGDTR